MYQRTYLDMFAGQEPIADQDSVKSCENQTESAIKLSTPQPKNAP